MKKPPTERDISQLMAEDAGKGVSRQLIDRAFWISDETNAWLDALETCDNSKGVDKSYLLGLLRGRTPIGDQELTWLRNLVQRYRFAGSEQAADLLTDPNKQARAQLADIFEAATFRRGRGRPQTPTYDRSIIEGQLELARDRVRELVDHGRGMSVKDAVEMVAAQSGIEYDALLDHYNGRRGVTNRQAKRRKQK